MNDWYENLVEFTCACWYLYCIVMCFVLLFSIETLGEIPLVLLATWVLLVLPAIIRGKW